MDQRRMSLYAKALHQWEHAGPAGTGAKNDVIWLSVISSAVGKQGYVTGPDADELTRTRGASPAAVLLDLSGTVSRLYQAKTTPHLFVIDKNGVLQYRGGIDSIASVEISDIASAEPYAKEA